jgi:hypothetical protein
MRYRLSIFQGECFRPSFDLRPAPTLLETSALLQAAFLLALSTSGPKFCEPAPLLSNLRIPVARA